MSKIASIEDVVNPYLVFENAGRRQYIAGIYGIPSYGGYCWYAADGSAGDCDTEDEAREEIRKHWDRGPSRRVITPGGE